MNTPHLNLVHLYPASMSTYGDRGNVICLTQRARWRNIDVTVHGVEVGQPLPPQADLYFFGGGQDAAQSALAEDLLRKGERIRSDVGRGVPLLAICGGYQLLGEEYLPAGQDAVPGIRLFPVRTQASTDRMIGNLIIEASPPLGLPEGPQTLVGFENHSGKTVFTGAPTPLGKVLAGSGNNGSDGSEGCVTHNAIGCYLHGSLLPKNPHLADWLLEKALGESLRPLDDMVEWAAHRYIVGRYLKG